jgi:hypothetical protein
MDILGNEEDSDTIAWLPHGRSFSKYKCRTSLWKQNWILKLHALKKPIPSSYLQEEEICTNHSASLFQSYKIHIFYSQIEPLGVYPGDQR